jgi:hypothetical protein
VDANGHIVRGQRPGSSKDKALGVVLTL